MIKLRCIIRCRFIFTVGPEVLSNKRKEMTCRLMISKQHVCIFSQRLGASRPKSIGLGWASTMRNRPTH